MSDFDSSSDDELPPRSPDSWQLLPRGGNWHQWNLPVIPDNEEKTCGWPLIQSWTPGKSNCIGAPSFKAAPGKKHPEWVQVEHAILSALKFPFHWDISGQRSHIVSVRHAVGLLPRAAMDIRIFVSDSDRQLVKGKGQACIFAGVLDSPPTPCCRFSNKYVDSPCAP